MDDEALSQVSAIHNHSTLLGLHCGDIAPPQAAASHHPWSKRREFDALRPQPYKPRDPRSDRFGSGVTGSENRSAPGRAILSSLASSLRPKRRDWDLAARDLMGGLAAYDIWMLLGTNDIRLRYNRSRFGQFWITLSMAIFIGGIGLVYSVLFNQPMQDYLPFLAVNITVWTLISGMIIDSSTVFTQAAVFMRQDALPRTIFVLRLMVRNLIVLAHNILIVPVAFLVFLVRPSWTILMAIPGLVVVLAALFFIILMLGVLATRFRDLPQIVQNAMQLLFFVTPIMWRADQLKEERQLVVLLNPFASLMRIVSEPLLGHIPSVQSYASAVVFVIILAAVGLPFFARFRARLVYWL